MDNYPLGWSDPACVDDPAVPDNECVAGPSDIDRNSNGSFDLGDAIQVTWTDSWDDDTPTGCIQDLPVIHGHEVADGISRGVRLLRGDVALQSAQKLGKTGSAADSNDPNVAPAISG